MNKDGLLSNPPHLGLGASPATAASDSDPNRKRHDVIRSDRPSFVRYPDMKERRPSLMRGSLALDRRGPDGKWDSILSVVRIVAPSRSPPTNSRLPLFRFPASTALDDHDRHNSGRSHFEFASKTCPQTFFFLTHDDPNASSHPEGTTYTSTLPKPLKRRERTVFRYGYHLCSWYGSTELHHEHEKREPEQHVSGMEMNGVPDYVFHPPPKQNCHVYPRRLDPTSGILHNFCSRACAKANSAAVKCEVLFSAAVGDRVVVWLTLGSPFISVALQSPTEVYRRKVHSSVLLPHLRQSLQV